MYPAGRPLPAPAELDELADDIATITRKMNTARLNGWHWPWLQAGRTIIETDAAIGRFVCTHGNDRRSVAISAYPPGPMGRMRYR
jgi:hypothetical protein